ncbi:stress response protein NST1-like [Aristolochia californica]|uniref:stress response protein NST1-like n=1 Tax=Aristolochia californica TaxID=171875 RepID=UPI0035DA3697
MQTQIHNLQQQQPLDQQMVERASWVTTNNHKESLTGEEKEEEEMTKSALTSFRAKEEEIERKKMEVKEKVHARLGRVEEETKRLADIREELETIMADPMRKEVGAVRKKIDTVNRELKPLGYACQKKEKEYKEALDAFNERDKEKALLITKLMELVTESERVRMKKLEELSKHIDSLP